jgi:hypothetical protein
VSHPIHGVASDDVASNINICEALGGGCVPGAARAGLPVRVQPVPRAVAQIAGKGLHSFTLELNLSIFGTPSWAKLGYAGHKDRSS